MKNKKSDSADRILPIKRIDSETVKPSIQRNKRKNAANTIFQRTNQILHTYNTIFKKSLERPGDAESYFRQTLRNYDDFELVKSTTTSRSENKVLRQAKSSDSVRRADRNTRTASSSLGETAAPKPEKREIGDSGLYREVIRVEKKEFVEEAELDVFYSPSSVPLDEGLADIREVDEGESNMAEEGDAGMEEESDVPEEETDVEDEAGEGELDDIEQVEKIIEDAVTELEQAAEESPDLEDAIGSFREAVEGVEDTGATGDQKDDDQGSVFKYDPTINNNILRELEEAEKQAKETAKIIYDLKERVAVLVKKEKMTEAEAKELEEKNRLLKEQMLLFEEKTRRIQFLVGQTNLFDKMIPIRPTLPQSPRKEDMLPKVIVCGMTEDDMPKIIVCNDKRKEKRNKHAEFPAPPIPPGCIPHMAQKLSQSYYMQEKLATENAELETMRYNLQEDLLNKDQTVESLQKKLHGLQAEMRMVCKENQILSEKLERFEGNHQSPCSGGDNSDRSSKKRMPCGKGKGTCPADVETRLQEYSETTQQLEQQLEGMENEVRTMQQELEAVQKERKHLEHHRRLLSAPPPCPMPPPCAMMPPCAMPPPCGMPAFCPAKPSTCPAPCNPNPMPMGISPETALRELREQYNRLQDDFKGKLTEVAGLRADNEKLKQTAKDAEEGKKIIEDRLKELEKRCKSFDAEKGKFVGSKEQLVEQEQQLAVAKQRFRDAQDELEELRALLQDQQGQLDDYRNKYLLAQQQVEEQRRQIDMMEMENNRIAEQVNLEIQRVKNQFQEKLQELTPLPEILKATQLKLQEAQQMHLMAERNNESLVRELQAFKDRAAEMENELEKQRSDQMMGEGAKLSLQQQLDEWERKYRELEEENENLRMEMERFQELAESNELKVQEKLHEIAQLSAQLETVREESARQVARIKDRCETVRRSMQNQIADLERQVAQSRAQAKAAQKDRDEIRQKMQTQINNLNENFEDAQMRIRNLQGHVNFLKTSYTGTFPTETPMGDSLNPCDCRNKF